MSSRALWVVAGASVAWLAAMGASGARAQDDTTIAEIRALRARLEQLETKVVRQDRLLGSRPVPSVATRSPTKDEQNRAKRVAVGPPTTSTTTAPLVPNHWYDRLSLRGYVQGRFNEVVSGDRDARLSADGPVGRNRSFLIRRARLILSGDVSDHLYVYIQPDFASTPGGATTGNFAQLRDAYGDIYFDKKKEFRIRAGQSKIPFSFENMQSSQNRLALDRNDALNTCCRDERDIGLFFYYTPEHLRHVFRDLVKNNLKGSGDYGMFAFGAYNGQGANRTELNDDLHIVSRFTYPYTFANGQIFEAGVQGLSGRFVPAVGATSAGRPIPVLTGPAKGYRDARVGVHAVLYPQPFGLQGEWNWGVGPQLNETQTTLTTRTLNGGYIQASYKYDDHYLNSGTYFPFIKYQYFAGASKFETNAPFNSVRDLEFGLEWQPRPELEFTVEYAKLNRTNLFVAPYRTFRADLLRTQLQVNF